MQQSRTMKINTQILESERARTNLSMARFSVFLGLSKSAYRKILMSESTTLSRLASIAKALHYSDPKDLLTS